ncbi:terminator protein [Pseudanabaena phage Pam3]|uniref:Terminator protein n=1 Tax=Pseudanabaena phage Pam3 TaxID=2936519 RepID=A0ACD6BAM7_9CAUD|nr:Chain G, Pam3 terminator protein [uncultured cyanophage]8HDR_H Chain H, Pam3 terminator protein [uncultured cyanophage]8HDR_I Chain I, Pam3 terminator protein [uncultured cyanophage]8HDR_J Chain J, Pam3 terminator protein [uncultured cyanophage]8HDR_K Chain K, Pam3 terminator protein [uncultured cyanophage]8HDR_L Chain L, Pam3 terminator protein [uncultured cyanophage]UQS95083.1 terminator protein [Pseudanabaena phage Pam3]
MRRITGITVIKDHQSEDRPALPYGVVELANFRDLHQQVRTIHYEDIEDSDNGEGFPEVQATPEVEQEWVFLVQVYGPGGLDYLRKVAAAFHVNQVNDLPGSLVIHEVAQINSIPEFLGERWEKRAQTNITLRGMSTDGFKVDVIEQHVINVTGERA